MIHLSPVFRLLSVLSISLIGLQGCQSLSKSECLNGDWFGIGRNDGTNGRYSTYLSNHREACASVGVIPDQAAWERGRQEGLQYYCTPSKAFENGKRGYGVNNVCPHNIQSELNRANSFGREIHDYQSKIDDNNRKISAYQSEINRIRGGDKLRFTYYEDALDYMYELLYKIDILNDTTFRYQRLINDVNRRVNY